MGTSEDKKYSTMMRDHFRICMRKGVVDTISQQKIFFGVCVDRWEKDKEDTIIKGS